MRNVTGFFRHAFMSVCGLMATTGWVRAATPPPWVQQAAAVATPSYAGDASSVVLLDNTEMKISAEGRMTTIRHFAVRILSEEGVYAAYAGVPYIEGSDRVLKTRAWLVRDGRIVSPKDEVPWVDVVKEGYKSLHEEMRVKRISRAGDARTNDVFAAETVVDGPLLIAEFGFQWATSLPTVEMSCSMTVPPAFEIQSVMHGTDAPVGLKTTDGQTMIWTLRNHPGCHDEALTPDPDPIDPVLYGRIVPPASADRFKPAIISSWRQLSPWIAHLNSGQCDSSPELAATAHRLTDGCKSELEKIRAIAAYVQKFNYVAIDIKLGRGLGYQPRKASQVFAQGYGDCKDKANLICAMLHVVGINAFIAIAHIGTDEPVWPEIPSPAQFDHAIAAIQVDATVDLPAVVATEKYGRVLFFDGTDPFTAVGDIPAPLQGTNVFITEPENDRLTPLPAFRPAAGHLLERKMKLKIQPDGTVAAEISLVGHGQAGARLRAELFNASTDELRKKVVRHQLGDLIRAAPLEALVVHDDGSLCAITSGFSKPSYVQLLRNGSAITRFDMFDRGLLPTLAAPERHHSIKIDALALHDEITVMLPAGWSVDDMPADLSVSTKYGRCLRRFQKIADGISEYREIELDAAIVPPDEYALLKTFLVGVGNSDRAAVLLKISDQ